MFEDLKVQAVGAARAGQARRRHLLRQRRRRLEGALPRGGGPEGGVVPGGYGDREPIGVGAHVGERAARGAVVHPQRRQQQVLGRPRGRIAVPGRGVGASVDGRDTRQLRLTSVVAGGTSVKRRLRVVNGSTPARSARVASSFRT